MADTSSLPPTTRFSSYVQPALIPIVSEARHQQQQQTKFSTASAPASAPAAAGSSSAEITRSRFGGSVMYTLPTDRTWPSCGQCDEPMAFMLQVDLDKALPLASTSPTIEDEDGKETISKSAGLLQLWACPNCQVDASDPFHPNGALLRTVFPSKQVKLSASTGDEPSTLVPPEEATVYPQFNIGNFDSTTEVPTAQQLYDLNELDLGDQTDIDYMRANRGKFAFGGTKFGGWPTWIQDDETPANCPRNECSGKLRFVMQVCEDKYLPREWGDMGMAYIHQCTEHPDVVSLVWQCS
ncbi:hypothetical protein GQ42DRAFT_161713 [Ramicandelaber brevisporus]|nr:hypothetical protein GQ42DRAFT_161713 [Ramicandelaber brevisporus]